MPAHASHATKPQPSRSHAEPDGLAEVLTRASTGDNDAWRQLTDAYAPRVHALLISRCNNPELAEELTQSVFVTIALKMRDGGYAEEGKFEAWLFRIAMNRLRDEMRRLRRRGDAGSQPLEYEEAKPQATPDPGDDLTRLRGAMRTLNEADRDIIELRHHGQMSFKAMADLLGEPVGTLLARHHRALRKLKSAIESASGPKRQADG